MWQSGDWLQTWLFPQQRRRWLWLCRTRHSRCLGARVNTTLSPSSLVSHHSVVTNVSLLSNIVTSKSTERYIEDTVVYSLLRPAMIESRWHADMGSKSHKRVDVCCVISEFVQQHSRVWRVISSYTWDRVGSVSYCSPSRCNQIHGHATISAAATVSTFKCQSKSHFLRCLLIKIK